MPLMPKHIDPLRLLDSHLRDLAALKKVTNSLEMQRDIIRISIVQHSMWKVQWDNDHTPPAEALTWEQLNEYAKLRIPTGRLQDITVNRVIDVYTIGIGFISFYAVYDDAYLVAKRVVEPTDPTLPSDIFTDWNMHAELNDTLIVPASDLYRKIGDEPEEKIDLD